MQCGVWSAGCEVGSGKCEVSSVKCSVALGSTFLKVCTRSNTGKYFVQALQYKVVLEGT